ncbi:probable high mobility group protein B1 [Coccomyxa sp. Obi]|nr:probable high mobility group protein B1 [Coccomyxa sp. Obi]
MDWRHQHDHPIYQHLAHVPAALQRGMPDYMQHSQLPQRRAGVGLPELAQYANHFGFQAAPGNHHLSYNIPQQQQQQQQLPTSSSPAGFQPSCSEPVQAQSQDHHGNPSEHQQTASSPTTQTNEEGPRVKKRRAKKPKDAPRRPKSAYMFFLAEFREKWKLDHPEMQRVSDVGVAAGEAWRSLTLEQKAVYEEQSVASKAAYAAEIAEYAASHPKPPKRRTKHREPGHLRRPTSAYFFFLNTFREAFKKENPDKVVPVGEMGRLAGVRWTLMSAAEREPYERLSAASKALYVRLKALTPEQRAAREAEAGYTQLLEEAGAGLMEEEAPSGEAASEDSPQNGAAAGELAAQHVDDMAQHAEGAAQRAADVAQHAADVAQQVDGLAQHQQDFARCAAHAASMAFGQQAVSAPVPSAAQDSIHALQEAFDKIPAASFPLAQFLSMDHPTVSHWVPQPFPLPPQRQPSPHHIESSPHQHQLPPQRQLSPQQLHPE